MNQPAQREVLECASPLALSDLVRARKSGRGLPQSKTLARQRPPRRGSWSQCKRQSEWRLSRNNNPVTGYFLRPSISGAAEPEIPLSIPRRRGEIEGFGTHRR